jgi:hypothetical protein
LLTGAKPKVIVRQYAATSESRNTLGSAHCGISRRIVIPNHTQILDRLLQTYPNLRVDISWVIFEQEIAPNGLVNKDWPALIEKYPDRFIIGSDLVGAFAQYKSTIQRYYVVLDALKPATAARLRRRTSLPLCLTTRTLRGSNRRSVSLHSLDSRSPSALWQSGRRATDSDGRC